MKPKIQKIKSAMPQKIGRILLWTIVVFLLLRGIGSVFKEDEKQTAQSLIDSYIKETQVKSSLELEGKSFAENFALEYLTMTGADSEGYLRRLKQYIKDQIDLNISLMPSIKTEAYNANSYSVHWTSEKSINVDVKVKVKYFNISDSVNSTENLSENYSSENYLIKNVNLRIPVSEKDGKFQISGYPVFIPEEGKADIKSISSEQKEAPQDVQTSVQGVMESFFKIYCAGSPGEISYYMLDSTKENKGLEGRYEFVSLNDLAVYLTDTENSYNVVVKLSVKDSINGVALPQEYKIKLVKKEEKYYIDELNIN